MLPLVILAGYSRKPKLQAYLEIICSALFNHEVYLWAEDKNLINLEKKGKQKPALEWLIENIENAKKVQRPIHVVGSDEISHIVKKYDGFNHVLQSDSIARNMMLGYEVSAKEFNLKPEDYVLFITSDLLLVNGNSIDTLIGELEGFLDHKAPLILSYIRRETLGNYKRRFVPFYDDFFSNNMSRYYAKESNIMLANSYADLSALDSLYNIRKLMNPPNWLKALRLTAETLGARNTMNLLIRTAVNYFKKRAVSTKMAVVLLTELLHQEFSLYEIKDPAFSMDADSRQDLKAMGFSHLKEQYQ